MKRTLYFAYGSNLSEAQMRARCPGARPAGRAALHGYRLAFAGYSALWGGAVATAWRRPTCRPLTSGKAIRTTTAACAPPSPMASAASGT